MKKKLEADLMSIAHRILKLKGTDDIDKMYEEVSKLHEKLSVLKFAKENFQGDLPSIGDDSSFFSMLDAAFNNKVSDNIEIENKVYVNVDDVDEDDIMEPAMEKIKDIVAQIPQEAQQVDDMIQEVAIKPAPYKKDLEELAADYTEMPVFDPIEDKATEKSLNDKLKNGTINIGLNDRIAFVKHLFDGKAEVYEKALNTLNGQKSLKEAMHFIDNTIKPEFNNWEGKEEYEERFTEIIEDKFS